MRKSLTIIGVVLLSAFVAAAQDVPRAETFLGYTYVRFNSATNVPAFSSNGGSGQFDYNFNKWLGFVADLGAVHNNNISGVNLDNTMASFLFGPRFSLHHSRIRPYFETLFGGAYYTASLPVLATIPPSAAPPIFLPGQPTLPTGGAVTARLAANQTVFAMAIGGGLDIKMTKHVSFRPIGLDYFMPRLQNLRTMGDNNQHCLRYTAGVNFMFGAR
jgi:hypothetical protein